MGLGRYVVTHIMSAIMQKKISCTVVFKLKPICENKNLLTLE